jgi:hypothetical protein
MNIFYHIGVLGQKKPGQLAQAWNVIFAFAVWQHLLVLVRRRCQL